ncbi:protein NRT1/ PTR FAMILY 1.2-like isoform X3 [Ziziphus jujuba]|uniref:Protein NRT1/ PTR FAMILY 1.2-like isoform X3 n=1 Tax=Ziziphus jujuba TaxID=326968 RepID=A0ABM3ILG9_ZIZJJ|nr:protein NRT1/ PTR FAMILY 1.2-like isoform X3 [Ziziphus jujuba]
MANPSIEEDEEAMEKPLLSSSDTEPPNSKGGIRTLPFILANEAFERLANYGLQPNMVLYLTREYGLRAATAANVQFLWSAATDFTPIVGAFLADSYVGRYPMIGFGCILCLLGTVLLWLTTIIPQARPFCDQFSFRCTNPAASQLLILYSSFGLLSIGAGGIRSSSLAFGVNQMDTTKNPQGDTKRLSSFISLYSVVVNISIFISFSCIAYIQEHMGWNVGFGVPALLMLLSVISFFLASPFYIKLKPETSILTGLAQVVVASYRNRDIQLSSSDTIEYYHTKGSIPAPSEKLRSVESLYSESSGRSQGTNMDNTNLDNWGLHVSDNQSKLISCNPGNIHGQTYYFKLRNSCWLVWYVCCSFYVTMALSLRPHNSPSSIKNQGTICFIEFQKQNGNWNFPRLHKYVSVSDCGKCSAEKGNPTRIFG